MKEKNIDSELLELSGVPQPRQEQFFMSKAKYVAYGGARGGGKSWALRRKLVLMCLNYPHLSVLLLRRSYGELRDNHIRPLLSELCDVAKYTDTRKCFEFHNGSVLRLGYLENENDASRYQGQEYDVIALDEATQVSEYQFQLLKGSLRGTNTYPKRFYLTCNPGGIGHAWVKRLFIDREFRKGENPSDYEFVPALVYDNKVLLEKDPDYLERLESLPESLKNAWLRGSWDEFEGQFFPEFDYSVHTLDRAQLCENVRKYCAIDYGLDMFAAVFAAVDEDGNAIVYDEIHKSGLIVSEAAKLILEKMEGVELVSAPSDLWSRQKDSGKSIAELFGENGVYLTKLVSDRVSGWMCLREYLKVTTDKDGNKTAKLRIMRNCTNLIRCLPLLIHDKTRSGDASTNPHSITHAPDALRYFAVSRQIMAPKQEKKSKVKLSKKLGVKNKI